MASPRKFSNYTVTDLGIICLDSHGNERVAILDDDEMANLQFTLDLLEKYESTNVGKDAIDQLLSTAFAFWEA